ncbi:MAG TPA: PIN domain-containing protein [Caulobacterales bacterium]|jgi:predicted nucleic-acid-binding protein|nr:PIN domain-containing protein [Caulobacterales bacterium]
MRAIDTNVLVRMLVRDDAVQAAAADACVAKGAWISHVVLAEATWVFGSLYSFSGSKIAEAVDLILRHKDLTIQDEDVVTRSLVYFRAHRKVEFADCLVLAIAEKAGHTPLGTFDRNLAKLEGAQRL